MGGIAQAQEAPDAAPTPAKTTNRLLTQATVGPSGRVSPINVVDGAPPERIGADTPASGASPCPRVDALATDVAKALVRRVAIEEAFYPDFVMSVVKIESGFDSTNVSPKGAYGLMQLMPGTAAQLKVDICDPEQNVRGGVRLLHTLHDRYRNPLYMLAAYNAGEDALRMANGLPPYPETLNYIAKIMNDFYGWPNLGGPPDQVRGGAPVAFAAGSFAPAAGAAPSVREKARVAQAEGWQSGFVQNFDYNK